MGQHILASTVPVAINAVKSVLFRTTSLLLDLSVFKIFALLAYYNDNYTAYLFLLESFLQKSILVAMPAASPPQPARLTILLSIILIAAAGFYDTLLWGLDDPGYVMRLRTVGSNTVAKSIGEPRKPEGIYDIGQADQLFQKILNKDLWIEGSNLTLLTLTEAERGHARAEVVAGQKESLMTLTEGPKIWFDNEGWAIVLDLSPIIRARDQDCNFEHEDALMSWDCNIDIYAPGVGQDYIIGQTSMAFVRFDSQQDEFGHWPLLSNINEDTGHYANGAIVTHTLITVTKGIVRQTMLHSTFEVTAKGPEVSGDTQDIDFGYIMRKTWSKDGSITIHRGPGLYGEDSHMESMVDKLVKAQRDDKGIAMGWVSLEDEGRSIYSRRYQFFKEMDASDYLDIADGQTYAGERIFQAQTSSLRLLRTDNISTHPVPAESCKSRFISYFYGGVPLATSCRSTDARPGNDTSPAGTMDSLYMTELRCFNPISDDMRSEYVLNDTVWEWYLENEATIKDLVITRGYFLAGIDRERIKVLVNGVVPAVSVAQLLLVAMVPLLWVAVWLVSIKLLPPHYQRSLFTVLVQTTGPKEDEKKSVRWGYIIDPPQMQVSESDRRTVLSTQEGVFLYEGADKEPNLYSEREGGYARL